MIRHLRNKDIDRDKWDRTVSTAFNGLVYAHSWYLDIVCPGWDALVEDDYISVFPLPRQQRFGLTYSFQPLLAQQLGLFSAEKTRKEDLDRFLKHIPWYFLWLKINLNAGNNFAGTGMKLKTNLVLNLNKEYSELAGNYGSGCLRNLKKSLKNNLQLIENAGTKDILKVLSAQMQEKDVVLTPKLLNTLEKLIDTATERGCADRTGLYTPEGGLCAAAVMIREGKRLYYLVGTSNAEGFEALAMFRIIDHVIKKYAGQDITLDFEGSEIDGISRFFKGFGAEEQLYPMFERRLF